MSYKYTKTNLLIKAENYHYSEFSGSSFLEKYLNDRIMFIKEIPQKTFSEYADKRSIYSFLAKYSNEILFKENALFTETIDYSHAPLSSFENVKIIETIFLLESILISQIKGDEKVNIELWLQRLIKKFEIKKKIYSSYQGHTVTGNGGYSDPKLYVLLSFILSYSYKINSEIKVLNSMLKINDTILSIKPLISEADNQTKSILKDLINFEILAIRNLFIKKGTPLETK